MRTPRLPVFDRNDGPADLNGLVPFAERRNLVSARVTSHFNWPVQTIVVASLNVMAHGDARGGEVKGKLANSVCIEYPSHYLGTWCMQHYYR
jgi:hypothetical protein